MQETCTDDFVVQTKVLLKCQTSKVWDSTELKWKPIKETTLLLCPSTAFCLFRRCTCHSDLNSKSGPRDGPASQNRAGTSGSPYQRLGYSAEESIPGPGCRVMRGEWTSSEFAMVSLAAVPTQGGAAGPVPGSSRGAGTGGETRHLV